MAAHIRTSVSVALIAFTLASAATLNTLAVNLTAPRPSLNTAVTCANPVQLARDNHTHHELKGGEKVNIDLTSREVPTPGEQPGVFADVIETVKTDKRGRNYTYLVLIGELAATKSSGKRFTAACSFNLDDARGLGNLRKQLQAWRGSDALPDLGGFNPEAEFLNKGFLAKPTVTDKGGKRQIQFSGFKRYTGDPIVVSADFVRANAAPKQP